MKTTDAHQLRAAIARLAVAEPILTPAAIATRVGCATSTVYRFLRDPAADGRTRNVVRPRRTDARVVACLRALLRDDPFVTSPDAHVHLLECARRDGSFPRVPSLRTVHRLVAELRAAPAEPPAADRPVQPAAPEPTSPPAPDLAGLTPESSVGDVLRALLCSTIADLKDPHFRSPNVRFRLRHQATLIAMTLARADRLSPPADAQRSELAERLTRVTRELRGAAAAVGPESSGMAEPHRDSPT